MLWENGTWDPVPGKDSTKTLAEGHLHFTLRGRRMKGEWIMFRLKPREKEKGENWMLHKVEDEFPGGSVDLIGIHLTSVDSGRKMEEIPAGEPIRSQGGKPKAPPTRPQSSTASARKSKNKGKLPPFQSVQLAALIDHVHLAIAGFMS